MKTRSSAARADSSLRPELGDLGRARAEHQLEPLAPPGERAVQERGRLGRDEMRRAQEPRQVVAEAEVVHAVPELVEHRVRRVVRLHGVGEDAHVAAAVDVDAERVLVLAVARVEIAPREDPLDVESDPLEGAARERDDVLPLEERVEVDRAVGRRLLEEGIRVVPRTQLRDGAAEASGQLLVERALPARERLGGHPIRVGERVDQLLLVELVGRQRQREPVAMAEGARGLVPEARELADVVGDLGANRLRRLPRLAALARIVASAEDPLDLGVLDLDAADTPAVAREAQVDRGLELDDPRAQIVRAPDA